MVHGSKTHMDKQVKNLGHEASSYVTKNPDKPSLRIYNGLSHGRLGHQQLLSRRCDYSQF